MNANLPIAPPVCPHDCTSAYALDVEVLYARTIGRAHGLERNAYTAGVVCVWVEHARHGSTFGLRRHALSGLLKWPAIGRAGRAEV